MIAAIPLSVSAAGEYVPGNHRWSCYQNQVQWGRPAGAASGDSFEYEAQLLLGDDVVESKAVEIDTYLFFTNDVVTRPQEEYTIRVRARWIMIVGDPDGQYMVADVGEAEPPHEHSYTQKHDAAQHWQECSCGDKKDGAVHSFGAWTADGNTESRICTVCGYAETRDAAQTSATGETTDNGQDSGGEGIAELTDENTGVSVSLSEAVPEGVELYAGVMEAESLLEEKPELKEALDGLLSVYEISIRQNGEPVEIKDSAMTVRIPMNSHLEGYAHYQAVRVDGEPERIEAKAEDGSLVFEAGGPGRYAVLGSDTPFSVSAIFLPDEPAPSPGDGGAEEKDGNTVYIVLLAAIPAAVLLALLLSLCMVAAMVPVVVLAAGQYVPENPRWSGYGNQVPFHNRSKLWLAPIFSPPVCSEPFLTAGSLEHGFSSRSQGSLIGAMVFTICFGFGIIIKKYRRRFPCISPVRSGMNGWNTAGVAAAG